MVLRGGERVTCSSINSKSWTDPCRHEPQWLGALVFILFSNNNIVQVLLFELFIKLLIFTAGELKNRNEQLKGLQARFEIFYAISKELLDEVYVISRIIKAKADSTYLDLDYSRCHKNRI